MDKLVGSTLETVLPTVRGARWGRNEEELAGVRKSEMLIASINRRRLSKIDLELLAEEQLRVPNLADVDGGLLVEEGDDNATEGLQWSKGVHGGGLRDQVANGLEVLGQENILVVEVGE